MAKSIEDYLKLPYTFELIPDPSGGYAVAVKELPGCLSQGDTPEEAIAMIRDAMAGWIEISLEDGIPIPEPRPIESYSGKFVVRVPRWLHRRLAEESEVEGVSLNQYINTALATASVTAPTGTIMGEKIVADSDRKGATTTHTSWPGLSEDATLVLRMAGLEREAGQLDERLFATWMESIHNTVEISFANGYYQETIRTLQQACTILEQNNNRSPFIQSLANMLKFQISLIEKSVRIQQAFERQVIQPEIETRIRGVNELLFQSLETQKAARRSLKADRESNKILSESKQSYDIGRLLQRDRDE